MDFIDDLIKKAQENFVTNEEDYVGGDGLLHCGKCHEPKQCRLIMNDKEVVVPCICSCEQKRIEQEEQERKERERMSQVRTNKLQGLPNLEMVNWNFKNDNDPQGKISQVCRRYVDNFEEIKKASQNGLLMYGTVGSGKTYYATCIANALLDKGYKVLVRNFSALASEIDNYSESRMEFMRWLGKMDLLVIDDLGTQRNTEYMNELVFSVIDDRVASGKPMIITTNLKTKAMENPGSVRYERVFSRIRGACIPLAVVSKEDKRFQPSDRVKDILGLTKNDNITGEE